MDELQHELRRCERNDGRLVVLLLDIDFFKAINDRHGHATGDQALRHFARWCSARCAPATACRLGGEEFALLMYDCEPASALVQAQRVRCARRAAAYRGWRDQDDRQRRLAAYRRGDTADGILARADVALYRANWAATGWKPAARSVSRGRDLGLDGAGRGGSGHAAVAASPRDRRRLRLEVLEQELLHGLVELELVLVVEAVALVVLTMYSTLTPRAFSALTIWSLSSLLTRGSWRPGPRTAAS